MISYRPHKFLWLWLPVVFVIVQLVLERLLPRDIVTHMLVEGGPHEFLQFLIITAAFFAAISIFPVLSFQRQKPLFLWSFLAAACCFYVAGEEVSWGQHIFEWATPEFWSQVNDQNETNFHNTSSWLDQKPRLLLEIGVIVGGLIIPFCRQFFNSVLPRRFALIYPSRVLFVTAFVFLVLKLVDKADAFGFIPFYRVSEIQELYLFYFVLLYLLALRKKITRLSAA